MKTYLEITTQANVITHPSIESWTIASLDHPEHKFEVIDPLKEELDDLDDAISMVKDPLLARRLETIAWAIKEAL